MASLHNTTAILLYGRVVGFPNAAGRGGYIILRRIAWIDRKIADPPGSDRRANAPQRQSTIGGGLVHGWFFRFGWNGRGGRHFFVFLRPEGEIG